MKRTADIIIIGGGVTGLLTAIHLRQLDVGDVLLLERHFVFLKQRRKQLVLPVLVLAQQRHDVLLGGFVWLVH